MSRRWRTVVVMAFAVAVFGAVSASSASAVTMALPQFSVETKSTSVSGTGRLFGLAAITCKRDKDTTEPISRKLGYFTIDFEECTLGGSQCHSLGDPSGIILVSGLYHLVLIGGSGAGDLRLIWFLLTLNTDGGGTELHIECAFLSTLIMIRGTVLGRIRAVGSNRKEFMIEVRATSATSQELKEYEDDNGTIVRGNVLLDAMNGSSTFSEAGEEAGPTTELTEKATELEN